MESNRLWTDAYDGSDVQTHATVEMEQRNNLTIVRIRGDIDTSNVDRIELALQTAAKGAASGMIVELNGVEYLNSAAVKMLLGLAEQLQARGLPLRVAMDDTAPMRKVLAIIHFERLVPLHRTVKEAEAQITAVQGAADAPTR